MSRPWARASTQSLSHLANFLQAAAAVAASKQRDAEVALATAVAKQATLDRALSEADSSALLRSDLLVEAHASLGLQQTALGRLRMECVRMRDVAALAESALKNERAAAIAVAATREAEVERMRSDAMNTDIRHAAAMTVAREQISRLQDALARATTQRATLHYSISLESDDAPHAVATIATSPSEVQESANDAVSHNAVLQPVPGLHTVHPCIDTSRFISGTVEAVADIPLQVPNSEHDVDMVQKSTPLVVKMQQKLPTRDIPERSAESIDGGAAHMLLSIRDAGGSEITAFCPSRYLERNPREGTGNDCEDDASHSNSNALNGCDGQIAGGDHNKRKRSGVGPLDEQREGNSNENWTLSHYEVQPTGIKRGRSPLSSDYGIHDNPDFLNVPVPSAP